MTTSSTSMTPAPRRPAARLAATLAWLLFGVAAGLPAPASALLFDDNEKAAEVNFPDPPPPGPKTSRLIEFSPGTRSRNRFAFDPDSLAKVDTSGQQFTLVITSPSGVANVSLEAFRCNKQERKRLAIGRDDGGWTPVTRGDWTRIGSQDAEMPWFKVLYGAMCSGGEGTVKPDVVVERLKAQTKVEY